MNKDTNVGLNWAGLPVDSKDAYLGVNWPNTRNFVVGRTGIGLPDRPVLAVLQAEGSVDHEPVFMADARADLHWRHVLHGPSDRIEGSFNLLGILA